MPSGGQNKIYSKQIADEIIELFSQGNTISNIAKTVGISVACITQWRLKYPLFDNEVSRAQTIGFEVQADSILEIADAYDDVNQARLKSDNLKWVLSKRASSTYGDRMDLTVNQTIDLTGALTEAKTRALRPVHDLDLVPSSQLIDTSSQLIPIDGGSKPLNDLIGDFESDPIEKASDDDDIFK